MEPGRERFAEKEEIFSFYLIQAECAFIDNPTDEELLLTRQDDFARAIARGVTDYELEVG